ncbi:MULTISPECIES: tyrosine-type recombinase/integrase [Streptosporangium]|uniref:Integrase n=1 Tax=Streptosporangium brasiliense TaxID=47480 RepID=A0ABT9RPR1_9ACTN|nr:site-specific integrase [Streptosporangium brasiliense]MDP9870340.1 integrase [Streptosporangium brasiliense]
MARKKLIRGMGSLKKVDSCKHGEDARCKCKWLGRWYDAAGEPTKLTFDDYDAGFEHLFQEYTKKRQGVGRMSKAKGKAPLLEVYAIEWLASMRDLEPASRRNYKSILETHAFPRLGKVPVNRINKDQIADLIDYLYSEDPETGKDPVYEGTVKNLIMYVLRPIFRQAQADVWRSDNPCDGHRLRDVPDAERYVPTPAEIHDIAHTIKPMWRLAIYLMAGCGLREGEFLGASTDIRKKDNRLWIYRQWHHEGRWAPLKYCKAKEGRWVPLDPIVAAELERHIADYAIPEGGLLFPSLKKPGQAVNNSVFNRALKEACIRLGLDDKDITAHNFRHAFASHVIDAGVPLPDVSRMLGHKSYETTFKTYYKMVDPSWERIQRNVNTYLSTGIPVDATLGGVDAFAEDKQAEVTDLLAKLKALGVTVTLEQAA